jgi:outer membrane protein TolC
MKQIIGAPLDAPLDVVGEVSFAPQDIRVEDDIRDSAETHEDVLNQRLAVRKLENELPVQRARVLPGVDVAAGATQRGDGDADGWEYEARVTASWTLFAGAERARVRQLRNHLADADLALDILLRERETTLRSFARRLDEALRQVEIGRQSLDVAARRAALYSDRWENGAIDILEYIRSQNDLEQSRVDLVDLEITYLETLADYRRVVGAPVYVVRSVP